MDEVTGHEEDEPRNEPAATVAPGVPEPVDTSPSGSEDLGARSVAPTPASGADPTVGQPHVKADSSRVIVGAAEFSWPVPDRVVVVSGRSFSMEIAAVALLYLVVGLWLCWQCRGIVTSFGDLVSGLFSSGLAFAFMWIITLVLGFVLYVGIGFIYIAYRLLLGDPVGRGLSATVFATITLLLFTSARSGVLLIAFVVSGVSCAVLFLSPWAARVFDGSPRRRNRPWQVVLAETVALSYFSIVGLFIVLALPGLRFVGQYGIGAKYVLYILVGAASTAAASVGYRRLNTGPDASGRMLLSIASGGAVIAQLFTFTGAGFALTLCVCGAVVIPLWMLPASRKWFGDAPVGPRSLIRFEAGSAAQDPGVSGPNT